MSEFYFLFQEKLDIKYAMLTVENPCMAFDTYH